MVRSWQEVHFSNGFCIGSSSHAGSAFGAPSARASGTIAEDGEEKTGDRIAAMRTAGSWCGWETGTEAEQAAAGNTRDLVEAVKSLTHGTKRTAS